MKLLRKLTVSVMGLFMLVLCFSFTSGAVSPDGMKTISRPSEIEALEIQDAGMIFYNAQWDDMTTITVPEKGWVIMDTTYRAEAGVYANPSFTKQINAQYYKEFIGNTKMTRCGYYLEKGDYYITPATYGISGTISVYAYFIPSSKVLSATVSLANDSSSAMLHCTSTMGNGALYRWVKDVSITDNIRNEQFYSNRNAVGDIEVKENGIYSVRVSTNDQEWSNYPVDIQVSVNGIVPQPAECKHNYKVVVDRKATCGTAGSQHQECTICGQKKASEVIPATGKHSYGSYVVTKAATAVAKGSKRRTCSTCGAKDSVSIPKLKATIKLNCTSLTLKVRQSTKALKVSGLAKGDSVKSWKSSNTKIVKVNNKGVITAQSRTGKAKVTVILKSGLKKSVSVKVQKNAVKTTKISGLSKILTLRKGEKVTLKPVITPVTSQDKVQYKSSNKKIASVSSKGKVQAKKAGKTKIIVTSGKKKVTVTIKVLG